MNLEKKRAEISAILDDIEASERELEQMGFDVETLRKERALHLLRNPDDIQEVLAIIARIEARLNGQPPPHTND